MKTCSRYKQTLPIKNFNKNNATKDRYDYYCRICSITHTKERRHRLGIYKPYSESKTCTQYLGIHIAERLLSNVFINVVRMPFHNHGYDFVCGKGFKVDVKSSCIGTHYLKQPNWHFSISKNIIADYFALLALDNRQSLNPMHLWIVPGNVINNKRCFEIQNNNKGIEKWLQYEQSLTKVICACNSLRAISSVEVV